MKNNVYNSINPLVPLKLPQFDKKWKIKLKPHIFPNPYLFSSSRDLKVKYHYCSTPIVKWSIWTPNLISFIARIATTNHFFSLILFFSISLSLFLFLSYIGARKQLVDQNKYWQNFWIRLIVLCGLQFSSFSFDLVPLNNFNINSIKWRQLNEVIEREKKF